jgi:UDP-GlcNAc3NAcA epimerase
MKILSIVGARPQFVKAAVVSRALRELDGAREVLVHTGQHYDENMSGVFFEELQIRPADYHLGIGGGPHGEQTGRMLAAIEQVMLQEQPTMTLVYGDTNSTLAGALAAAKLKIPVAHVEAGLRSFNRTMPEEVNRVLTDHVSTLLFAPTDTAVTNLRNEGIAAAAIHQVGDVMYDAALFYRDAAGRSEFVDRLGLKKGSYILATVHRAENTDDQHRLRNILHGLNAIGARHTIVFPLHPRTRQVMDEMRMTAADLPQIRFVEPLGYLDMVSAESHAALIVTDSGGVQKEAYFYGVPCVTLRDETEWVELVQLGWNQVVPPSSADAVRDAVLAAFERAHPNGNAAVYGDGHAGRRIARAIAESQH